MWEYCGDIDVTLANLGDRPALSVGDEARRAGSAVLSDGPQAEREQDEEPLQDEGGRDGSHGGPPVA